MSLRVVILGEPSGWHAGRLAAAMADRGHGVEIVPWNRLTAAIDAGMESFGPSTVADADLIAVRGMPGGGRTEDRLEEVIFRMNVLGRVAALGTPVVNTPQSLEVAIDKYLSLCRIAAAGVSVPRTRVVQDAAGSLEAWRFFGGDCLLKPLFGSRGRGLVRITSADDLRTATAEAASRDTLGGIFYLQEFIPHAGWDVRILLVGDQAFAMRRRAASGDWRTNIACGGTGEPFPAPPAWIELARRAAAAVGTEIAGVDLLPNPAGDPVVLEVNGVPGWRGLEKATGEDVTAAVARHLEVVACNQP